MYIITLHESRSYQIKLLVISLSPLSPHFHNTPCEDTGIMFSYYEIAHVIIVLPLWRQIYKPSMLLNVLSLALDGTISHYTTIN